MNNRIVATVNRVRGSGDGVALLSKGGLQWAPRSVAALETVSVLHTEETGD